MAKVTDTQLRELMLLIYEAATGHRWSAAELVDLEEPPPRRPRRPAAPRRPAPAKDEPSAAFLAEFGAWKAGRVA